MAMNGGNAGARTTDRAAQLEKLAEAHEILSEALAYIGLHLSGGATEPYNPNARCLLALDDMRRNELWRARGQAEAARIGSLSLDLSLVGG